MDCIYAELFNSSWPLTQLKIKLAEKHFNWVHFCYATKKKTWFFLLLQGMRFSV